jgi:hypothetical protein
MVSMKLDTPILLGNYAPKRSQLASHLRATVARRLKDHGESFRNIFFLNSRIYAIL